ncbi:MAG TPA: DUF1553 domain-containing protein [Terriglobia bacterium]|nr:DUF1553 domain-containing protein [Terriglobia bacterium]
MPGAVTSGSSGSSGSSGQTIDFNRDLAPIFRAYCVKCHGLEKPQAQLRLDSETAVRRGGLSGKIIVPGRSGDSLLIKRLLGFGDIPRMPLNGDPLPTEKINLIRAWIDQGAEPGGQSAASSPNPGPQPAPAHAPSTAESTLFVAKIRPILAARCYTCHGPDVQQNGLRLDSLTAALKGSITGKVILPGDSERSPLVRRLFGLDRPQMPYGGPPLAAEQIALIRQWIDQGAPGPDSTEAIVAASHPLKHWAYVKPVRPELPPVKDSAWCRNPIDRFVLARLEKEGLTPSPEADKVTLIRRLSLDLIGLPPTLQEVDDFLADKNPEAYDKVVDRLLASPHYGERWARPWLDLARYADSNGYEKDDLRTAWEYRDWVIKALNENMSFKEFTIEQIAGDMLANSTDDQKVASGFNRNTLLNEEGGVDKAEARWETLVDRVNTTATVWLGTTLGCAQCHNHKFDPFTQKDYYRFLAFFDSNANYTILNLGQGEGHVWEPEIELPTPEQAAKSKELKAEIAKLQSVLDTSTPELEAAQAKWESDLKRDATSWTVLRPDQYSSVGGATLKLLDDGSILAGGRNPNADTYVLQAKTEQTGITGVRLEALSDPSLPQGGPGRDPDGNFFLSAFEVEASPADQPEGAEKVMFKVEFKQAAANESQDGYSVTNLVRKRPDLAGWAIDSAPSSVPIVRFAVLIPDKPFGFEHGTLLTIRLKHEMRHSARNLGRFRLSVTTLSDPASIAKVPARLRPVVDVPSARRTEKQRNDVAALYRSISPILQPTRDQIAKLELQFKGLDIPTAEIMGERLSFERPYTYIRIRGSYYSQGDQVYAGVPAVLGPLPSDQMPNRLGLANWLVSDDNPLTARVTVNHFWEQIFGRGIVETSEDFGTQGDAPTHPELLDWLATEFMGNGWDMKKIIRLMVTSATYRQSSRVTPELEERDPYNKLLARGPRFRVEGEMVRDVALAASGLLSPKLGGPSVYPYQPEGVWDRPYSSVKWIESKGEDRYRRGIYTEIRRTSPYPSLVTFDAPSREFCTVRRVRTNTPLQALTALNDPAFFEAAQALARHLMTDVGADPTARAVYGFRRVLARRPTAPELDRILGFYRAELGKYQQDPKAASAVIKGYASPSLNAAEQAAWTMVGNVLLNLDETITKE